MGRKEEKKKQKTIKHEINNNIRLLISIYQAHRCYLINAASQKFLVYSISD